MLPESGAIVEGFVTDEPIVEKSKTGKTILMFSLAIRHYTRPGEPSRVSFIEVEAWEELADINAPLLEKGKRVIVKGRLRQDRWEEHKGECSRIKIFADGIYYK